MRSQVLILTAVLLLQACGTMDAPGSGIAVQNYFFFPAVDTVTAGGNDSATVTFRWGSPSDAHTVTWDTGPGTLPMSSQAMYEGTYMATLVPGTYTYHCEIHTAAYGMRGIIVVLPAGSARAF